MISIYILHVQREYPLYGTTIGIITFIYKEVRAIFIFYPKQNLLNKKWHIVALIIKLPLSILENFTKEKKNYFFASYVKFEIGIFLGYDLKLTCIFDI